MLKAQVGMTAAVVLLRSDKVYWQVADHPAKGIRRESLQGRLSWEKKTFVLLSSFQGTETEGEARQVAYHADRKEQDSEETDPSQQDYNVRALMAFGGVGGTRLKEMEN